MNNLLIREFTVEPAYDHRAEGKGQHCVDMLWLVKGPLGVIQFRLFTGWSKAIIALPTADWRDLRVRDEEAKWGPMPADIGYHSPKPMYEGQLSMGPCTILDGAECYYDGSTLNADRYFAILVHEGGEALWKSLETYYAERFEMAELKAGGLK